VQLLKQENHTGLLSLKAKLFALGGDEVSPQPCPFISVIAGRGQLMDLPITVRRIQASCCHYNVASLWDQRKERGRLKAITTGYALSEDGIWRWHSWGLTTTRIIETTIRKLQYFGIPLHAEGADYFTAGFLSETEADFNAKLAKLGSQRTRQQSG
jgi:hypothetical protein